MTEASEDRGTPEGLVEPLPRPLADALRRAVLAHAVTEHRRWFPTVLHAGDPGGREQVLPSRPDEPFDHALRTDAVAAMLARARDFRQPADDAALVWLTRPGPLELQDEDAAWLAAVRAAAGEAGRSLAFVVVNRHGWWDPRTDLRREWRRLRPR